MWGLCVGGPISARLHHGLRAQPSLFREGHVQIEDLGAEKRTGDRDGHGGQSRIRKT